MLLSFLFALSPLITLVAAQAPPYLGELLISPGNDNGKCLTAKNSAVSLQDCAGTDNQHWTFSGGAIRMSGGKCLGVKDDGTSLVVQACGQNATQFQYTKFGDNHIKWKGKDKCLDTKGSISTSAKPVVSKCSGSANQVWNVGYMANNLPNKSESGQTGTNRCGTGSSQSSSCQTIFINDADDFCLYAPPSPGKTIGDSERETVAWCTKGGHGTRVMPRGTLKGVHFVKTPSYVQVTGVGDFTKINVKKGDDGGELDPHGADGNGNPIGGLVYGNVGPNGDAQQYHEWTMFMSDNEFCFRACKGGPNARKLCQHIYDVMGCAWNMPANYSPKVFESCQADDDLPMGIYGTSTWHQGVKPTPPPHPAASSSQCKPVASPTGKAARRDIMTTRVSSAQSMVVTAPPS